MKNLLYFLHTTAITDPQYQWTFDQLIKGFNQHISQFGSICFLEQTFLLELCREEETLIPKLEKTLSSNSHQSLSHSFEKSQRKNQRRFTLKFHIQ